MRTVCKRLRRGEDLLLSIRALAQEYHIRAGVVLSAVGCVSFARVRDAGGVNLRDIPCRCEILSLGGTVSQARCHLHIALAREDLSTLGGHLVEGCMINTTCELVLGILEDWELQKEFDEETGYNEVVFQEVAQ